MSDGFSPLDADALIEHLGLAPHPEGGWYRETWRADPGPCADREDSPNAAGDGQDAKPRARATAIMFLLKSDENSHWHRVDADELWIWQGGDPLDLAIAPSDARPQGAQAQTTENTRVRACTPACEPAVPHACQHSCRSTDADRQHPSKARMPSTPTTC